MAQLRTRAQTPPRGMSGTPFDHAPRATAGAQAAPRFQRRTYFEYLPAFEQEHRFHGLVHPQCVDANRE
ncbi:MAG: hypothetical protein FWF12_05475 [Betaproteobacteria bacterium]|nr:hypothetical protein [Betaproteobacteria bacterium]